tara:strand:- start:438 stop:623 length:186 start_codon:yes stop_codon:yes gene_type:complete
MANPIIHTLVFIAAVLIPGGLLVYFAWRATRRVDHDQIRNNGMPMDIRHGDHLGSGGARES